MVHVRDTSDLEVTGHALSATVTFAKCAKSVEMYQQRVYVNRAYHNANKNNGLLAHLSQRLMGELIGYSWPGVRRRPSTISNVFSSETLPLKCKIMNFDAVMDVLLTSKFLNLAENVLSLNKTHVG